MGLHFTLCIGQVIDELEKETEKARAIREMEERLMASAFYDLGMKLHRGAVEDRLKNLSQGQSFLARQRQVLPREFPLFPSLLFFRSTLAREVMGGKSTTMTDTEEEQLIVRVAPTKNCDRELDRPLDCEVQRFNRTDSQSVPNLQALNSNSGLVKDCDLDAENISKENMGSDAVTDPCAGNLRNDYSVPPKLCLAEVENEVSSSQANPDATMPASLDCIRVLSSTNSMEWEERDRAASARSTRRAKKTRKQAKRFGFWVLSKIFV